MQAANVHTVHGGRVHAWTGAEGVKADSNTTQPGSSICARAPMGLQKGGKKEERAEETHRKGCAAEEGDQPGQANGACGMGTNCCRQLLPQACPAVSKRQVSRTATCLPPFGRRIQRYRRCCMRRPAELHTVGVGWRGEQAWGRQRRMGAAVRGQQECSNCGLPAGARLRGAGSASQDRQPAGRCQGG